MAYKIKELEEQALDVIKKNNLFFITDVPAFLPCSTSTFYDLGLEKSEPILKAIWENKVKTKTSMKAKWYKSDNATLQIALMKLICEDDERKKLTSNYQELAGPNGTHLLDKQDPKVLETLLITAYEYNNTIKPQEKKAFKDTNDDS